MRPATRDDFAEVGGIGARRVSCDRLREPNLDLLLRRVAQAVACRVASRARGDRGAEAQPHLGRPRFEPTERCGDQVAAFGERIETYWPCSSVTTVRGAPRAGPATVNVTPSNTLPVASRTTPASRPLAAPTRRPRQPPAGTRRIRMSAGSVAYEPRSSFPLGILHLWLKAD